jgi:carboxypeptidase family protein
MSSSLTSRSLLVCSLLLLLAGLCWAQKDTGNIVGTVRDSSGAMVPRTSVTITDVDRGTSYSTSTNDSGEYVSGPLKIGRYRVKVEKQGFKTMVVGPVQLNVQERPSVNITLQVGQVQQEVTVTSLGAATANRDLRPRPGGDGAAH